MSIWDWEKLSKNEKISFLEKGVEANTGNSVPQSTIDAITSKIWGVVAAVVTTTVITIAVCFLTGLVVMWLWNWLVPDIFGLTTITYWQGWGISVLSAVLFKRGSGGNYARMGERGRERPSGGQKGDL